VVSLLFLPTIYTLLDDANLNLRRIIGKARERAPLAAKGGRGDGLPLARGAGG
jgi:hypothetical protein